MAASVYLVESVGLGRSIRVHRRSHDYDVVSERFRSMRKYPCRELRMVMITDGVRVLLKYITKARNES